MNSKMTTNSQLPTTEPKTKGTTGTGTEPEKWRSHGGSSAGRGTGKMGGEGVQGIRSINVNK